MTTFDFLFQLLIDPSFILSIQTFWAFIRLVLFCIGLLLYDATFSFFSVEFFHFNRLNLIFNHSEFLLILSAFVLFSHLISSIIYVSNILNIYFGIKCNFFPFPPPPYLYFLKWWFLFLIHLIALLVILYLIVLIFLKCCFSLLRFAFITKGKKCSYREGS